MRLIRNPIATEVRQFKTNNEEHDKNMNELVHWMGQHGQSAHHNGTSIYINYDEVAEIVECSDWIIMDQLKRFHHCDDETFRAIYPCDLPNSELKEFKEFISKFVKEDSYIVGSHNCSLIEIAEARVDGRMFVDQNNLGHIIRLKKNWEMMKAAFAHCFQGGSKPEIKDFQ